MSSPSTLGTAQFPNAEPNLFGESFRPLNDQNFPSHTNNNTNSVFQTNANSLGLNLTPPNTISGLTSAKSPSEKQGSTPNGSASGVKGSQDDDFTNLLSDAFTLSPTVNKNQ